MKKNPKILIVEDEQVLSTMYADLFSGRGWKVTTAASQNEGLKLAKKAKPDIILLDILLFDGHGIEFLREKQKETSITKISVVVFSNLDDPKVREQALELGALDYLLKTSYTPQELIEKVNSCLK